MKHTSILGSKRGTCTIEMFVTPSSTHVVYFIHWSSWVANIAIKFSSKDMAPLFGEKVYLMQIPSPSGKGKTDQVALCPSWPCRVAVCQLRALGSSVRAVDNHGSYARERRALEREEKKFPKKRTPTAKKARAAGNWQAARPMAASSAFYIQYSVV